MKKFEIAISEDDYGLLGKFLQPRKTNVSYGKDGSIKSIKTELLSPQEDAKPINTLIANGLYSITHGSLWDGCDDSELASMESLMERIRIVESE